MNCAVDTQQSAHNYKAVQLFRPNDTNNGYTLDKDALESIFSHPDVANTPVAIYSLAGDFRTGKSFMLNLFLRFLRSGRSKEWRSKQEETLRFGFVARGGDDPCTKGIWLWNEPFHVTTNDGDLIIFLMDTQGTFDHDTSMANTLLIFALSTFISSVQIFNVMTRIKGHDLQHLQLFTEYGKCMNKQYENLQNKSFQHLMFLVRDWCNPDCSYGITGGAKILESVMKIREHNKDSKSICESITTSFETVDCFLLPKPGNKVEIRGTKSQPIKIKDVSEEFFENVDELVQNLFEVNITPKRMLGNAVTGRDLINVTITYSELFEKGCMPEVETIMQSIAKTSVLTTIQSCRDKYFNEMEKLCGTEYMKPKLLDDKHKICKSKAFDYFDKLPKMGTSEFISTHRQHLSSQIEQEFRIFQQRNNALLEKIKNEIQHHMQKATEFYKLHLEEKSENSYVGGVKLMSINRQSRDNAIKFYMDSTKNFDREILSEFDEQLEKLLQPLYDRFQNINNKKKEMLQQKFSEVLVKAKKSYTDAMDQTLSGRWLEETLFVEAHTKSVRNVLAHFDSSLLTTDQKMIDENRTNLMADLGHIKDRFEKTNNGNKKLHEAKAATAVLQVKDSYISQIKKNCSSYKATDYLDGEHKKCKKIATKIFYSAEKDAGSKFEDRYLEELNDVLEAAFQNIKAQNETIYKVIAVGKLEAKASEALEKYKTYMMSETNTYIEESNLKSQHKEVTLEAIQVYKLVKNGGFTKPNPEYKEIKSKLKANIATYFTSVEKENAHNKDREIHVAEKSLQGLMSQYMEDMRKVCDQTYIEPDALEDIHKQIKIQFKEKFKICLCSNSGSIFQKMSGKFNAELQANYAIVKTNNAANKYIFLRKLGLALLKIIVVIVAVGGLFYFSGGAEVLTTGAAAKLGAGVAALSLLAACVWVLRPGVDKKHQALQ